MISFNSFIRIYKYLDTINLKYIYSLTARDFGSTMDPWAQIVILRISD